MNKLDIYKCKEFAMWFAANWDFYDSTEKGEMYESKTGDIVVLSIDEIFNKWANE